MCDAAGWAGAYPNASLLLLEEEPAAQSVIIFINLLQERIASNPWTVPALDGIEPALLISSLLKPTLARSSLSLHRRLCRPPFWVPTVMPIEPVTPVIESAPTVVMSALPPNGFIPAVIESVPPPIESVLPVIESALPPN